MPDWTDGGFDAQAAEITAFRQQVKALQVKLDEGWTKEQASAQVKDFNSLCDVIRTLRAEVKTRDEQIARLEAAGDTEQRAALIRLRDRIMAHRGCTEEDILGMLHEMIGDTSYQQSRTDGERYRSERAAKVQREAD